MAIDEIQQIRAGLAAQNEAMADYVLRLLANKGAT